MRPKSGAHFFCLHHADCRQDFLGKGNEQTTEQAKNTLRSLRRVVGLHGHTELHNSPAEDDNADGLDAGEDKIRKIVYDGQRVRIGGEC